MAENITAKEFVGRMEAFALAAPGSAMPAHFLADALHEHINAFEPTRKALAYLLGVERQNRPQTNVLENGAPCLTALQILERITFVVKECPVPDLTSAEANTLLLGELAHLANVAMGRAAIGDWPKPKEPWPENVPGG
ncbi:MAG: hypothetical protein IT538_09025 [Variibacter sp.]|nr:hypothetical protein [Variibacter sp.]